MPTHKFKRFKRLTLLLTPTLHIRMFKICKLKKLVIVSFNMKSTSLKLRVTFTIRKVKFIQKVCNRVSLKASVENITDPF